MGSSIFQHTRDARGSPRVLDGPFDSRWEPGFHKNLHRAPFRRFARGDDLIKYGCILRIWIHIPGKGTRCSLDAARSSAARDAGVANRRVYPRKVRQRTDRSTDARCARPLVTGFPIRLIAPSDQIRPRRRDDEIEIESCRSRRLKNTSFSSDHVVLPHRINAPSKFGAPTWRKSEHRPAYFRIQFFPGNCSARVRSLSSSTRARL